MSEGKKVVFRGRKTQSVRFLFRSTWTVIRFGAIKL